MRPVEGVQVPDPSAPVRASLSTLAGLAIFAVAPLFPADVDPWFRFALIAVAAIAALALTAQGVRTAGGLGLRLALLAAVPLAVSTWNSVDPGASRDRLVDMGLWLLAFLLARDLLGAKRREALLALLAGVGALTAVHAVYQRLFGLDLALQQLAAVQSPDPRLAEAMAIRLSSDRVFATFVLPSTFAGYLLISLPVTAFLAVRVGIPRAERAAWGAAMALQALALFLTLSHGAWLALAVSLGAVGLAAGSRVLRRAALGAAALALALLLLVGLLRGEELSGPGSSRHPVTQRLGNWQVALAELQEHPVAGVGPGAFGAAYTPHREPHMNETRYTHNTWLQLVAEGGLALLPFLLLLPAWVVARLLHADEPGDRVLLIAVIAVLLHNVIDFTLLLPGVAIPFFGLLGVLAAPRRAGADAGVRRRLSPALLGLAVAGFGIPAALAAVQAAEARTALLAGQAEEGRRRIEQAVTLDPWNAGYRDFRARWELEHGDHGAESIAVALDAAAGAIRLAPLVPHHRTTLELACRAAGDVGCAYRSAARAAALYPSSREYATRLQDLLDELRGAGAGTGAGDEAGATP